MPERESDDVPVDEREQHQRAIADHYGRTELNEELLDALADADIDPSSITHEDVASVGEFHVRGRTATRELADLAGFQPGTHVLDVGCGIGGPARTLAVEYKCRVTGVDLVESYVETARRLTELVGLADSVDFRQADALSLPFEDNTFDAVVLQHVSMNVPTKDDLFRELGRVLSPDGTLSLYEICAGEVGKPFFPVPWADDESISFLVAPDELISTAEACGFAVRSRQNATADGLAWFQNVMESAESQSADAPPPPGPHLLMGEDAPEKMGNVVRNLETRRIEIVQLVFDAP